MWGQMQFSLSGTCVHVLVARWLPGLMDVSGWVALEPVYSAGDWGVTVGPPTLLRVPLFPEFAVDSFTSCLVLLGALGATVSGSQ